MCPQEESIRRPVAPWVDTIPLDYVYLPGNISKKVSFIWNIFVVLAGTPPKKNQKQQQQQPQQQQN